MSKITAYVIIGLLATIVVLIFLCMHFRNNSIDAQAKVDYANQQIDTLRNQKGIQIAQQTPAVTTDPNEIKKLSAEVFDLKASIENKIKNVQALVTAQQKFVLHDTTINYVDSPTAVRTDSIIHAEDVIIPPRKFSFSDSLKGIVGSVELHGIHIDSAWMNNKISFRVAEIKKGLFKSSIIVQAINSNPDVHTIDMQSIILKPTPSAWNVWMKPAVVAAIAVLLTKKL